MKKVNSFIESLESRRLFNAAGQLDPSFGNGGKVVNFGDSEINATAVAPESDGKTVEVGYGGKDEFVIVQLNFNGTRDTSFGPNGNGIVFLQPGGSGVDSEADAVAVDNQGRILVAGTTFPGNQDTGVYVARYLPNGTLDTTYGKHGIAYIPFGSASVCGGIALQSNGKIVVVGESQGFFNSTEGLENPGFAIARLNTNGTLDSSFNGGGTEIEGFSGVEAGANAVTIDYSGTPATNPHYGTIVVSGYTNSGSDSRIAAIRLKPNGGLDSSFNGSGEVQFEPKGFSGGDGTGVVVQSTGDIVLSGTLGTHAENGNAYEDFAVNGQFALVRLTPSGHLDTTFANGKGFDTVAYGPTQNGDNTDYGKSLLLGPNNRLIVGGSAGNLAALLGFTASGQRDSTFGVNGIVSTNIGDGDGAAGLAYLGDRIVAVGGYDIARYIDTNPTVSIGTFDTATATPQSPVTFIVARSQILPYDTSVDFSIGGTAIGESLFAEKHHDVEYTVNGLTIPEAGVLGSSLTPYVDIPAGQSYVLVTVTPVANSPLVGTATASFSVLPNTFYSVSNLSSVTINISKAPTALGDTADAYVQDGSTANENFGTGPSLVVKTGSVGFNRYTYIKFDLSSVTNIDSAELELHGNLSDGSNSSVITDVYSVANTSWSETGITFNNAPPRGASPLASAIITGTTPQEYTWNVTAYLQAQKAAGNNIVSFVLEDPISSDSAVILNSRREGMGPALLIS